MIGTDPHVDRRLSAVAEVEIPFYPGLKIGVPSLPAVVEALAEGRYGVLHLCSPGPGGRRGGDDRPRDGAADRRLLPHRAGGLHGAALRRRGAGGGRRDRAGRLLRRLRRGALAVGGLRRAAGRARASRASRIGRWDRGVDVGALLARAAHARGRRARAGALRGPADASEKGVDLLADAFLAAQARDPRLELVLAGGGPEEDALRDRLGGAATFLGWLEGEELARAYADADLFLFCSRDRHLRAGGAGGTGVGAAGRRGRRRRPLGADRDRPLRRALPRPRRARSPTPSPASPPTRARCAAWPRAAWPR